MHHRPAAPTWRLIRPLACAGLAAAAAASPAQVVCHDESGRRYVLRSAPQATLARFECVTEAGPPVPPPAAAGNSSALAARLALALPEPAVATLRSPQRGGLALVVWSAPAPAPGAATPLQGLIEASAQRHGHDANLIKAMVHVESGFNPQAVSSRGAIGLMQVMPATGRRLGVEDPALNLFDPARNLDAGARYMRLLLDLFDGQAELALAAYNAGEGAVLRHGGRIPPYPETQAYVRNVMAKYQSYRAP